MTDTGKADLEDIYRALNDLREDLNGALRSQIEINNSQLKINQDFRDILARLLKVAEERARAQLGR